MCTCVVCVVSLCVCVGLSAVCFVCVQCDGVFVVWCVCGVYVVWCVCEVCVWYVFV